MDEIMMEKKTEEEEEKAHLLQGWRNVKAAQQDMREMERKELAEKIVEGGLINRFREGEVCV